MMVYMRYYVPNLISDGPAPDCHVELGHPVGTGYQGDRQGGMLGGEYQNSVRDWYGRFSRSGDGQ